YRRRSTRRARSRSTSCRTWATCSVPCPHRRRQRPARSTSRCCARWARKCRSAPARRRMRGNTSLPRRRRFSSAPRRRPMTSRAAEAGVSQPFAAGTSAWSRVWQNHAPGYLFLLPWFIGFFGLTLGPIISSLYLSFTDFDLLTSPDWVGTANYERMFTNDPKFAAAMRVTLFFVVFSVPLKLAFALGVALLLNRGMHGLPLYRALFYLPS